MTYIYSTHRVTLLVTDHLAQRSDIQEFFCEFVFTALTGFISPTMLCVKVSNAHNYVCHFFRSSAYRDPRVYPCQQSWQLWRCFYLSVLLKILQAILEVKLLQLC